MQTVTIHTYKSNVKYPLLAHDRPVHANVDHPDALVIQYFYLSLRDHLHWHAKKRQWGAAVCGDCMLSANMPLEVVKSAQCVPAVFGWK